MPALGGLASAGSEEPRPRLTALLAAEEANFCVQPIHPVFSCPESVIRSFPYQQFGMQPPPNPSHDRDGRCFRFLPYQKNSHAASESIAMDIASGSLPYQKISHASSESIAWPQGCLRPHARAAPRAHGRRRPRPLKERRSRPAAPTPAQPSHACAEERGSLLAALAPSLAEERRPQRREVEEAPPARALGLRRRERAKERGAAHDGPRRREFAAEERLTTEMVPATADEVGVLFPFHGVGNTARVVSCG